MPKRPHPWLRGERSPNHKLTEEQARIILDYPHVAGTVFCLLFGVARTTTSYIRNGRAWSWLKHPNRGKPFNGRGNAYWTSPSCADDREERVDRIARLWNTDRPRALKLLAKLDDEAAGYVPKRRR